MNYLSLIQALRIAIKVVWPECEPNGVYLSVQLPRVPFEVKSQNGELPIAVIDMQMTTDENWGGYTNRVKSGTVVLHYIHNDSITIEDGIIQKLQDMRSYLFPEARDGTNNLEYGQVVADPDLRFDLGMPVNQHFITQGRPFFSGCVIARVVAGEIHE